MFKNVNSNKIFSDSEYETMIMKEYKDMWKDMDAEDKAEWGTFEKYLAWCKRNVDTDFKYVEN